MPALSHHVPFRLTVPPYSPGSAGPKGNAERLRWLGRQIADDDRDAFCELFDRCSEQVWRSLGRQVVDPRRAAGVFAGTFVEVWWLAGRQVEEETDVMAWIEQIVQRRVTDSQPAALAAAVAAAPGVGLLGVQWAQGDERELAQLLGRHH